MDSVITLSSTERIIQDAMLPGITCVNGIELRFESNLEKNELLEQLKKMGKNLLVVFWYVGINGLKFDGAKYYQKLFKQILTFNPDIKIMLYDLTAMINN